jgi:hypothetical protein
MTGHVLAERVTPTTARHMCRRHRLRFGFISPSPASSLSVSGRPPPPILPATEAAPPLPRRPIVPSLTVGPPPPHRAATRRWTTAPQASFSLACVVPPRQLETLTLTSSPLPPLIHRPVRCRPHRPWPPPPPLTVAAGPAHGRGRSSRRTRGRVVVPHITGHGEACP